MDKKMSIMVVDDEEIVRKSLFHWFKKYGHVVETASSGFEALEKLEKYPFQLLFVDITFDIAYNSISFNPILIFHNPTTSSRIHR